MPISQNRDNKLLVWGRDMEENTIQQALRTARLPFVEGHVALMPDAHVGAGSTVGSVIPTRGAVIPAAIGVDIGCGMVASRTSLCSQDLPDLTKVMDLMAKRIPAGLGKSFSHPNIKVADAVLTHPGSKSYIGLPYTTLDQAQRAKMANQFATMGSGNHFGEVCVSETNEVWTVLHSGSRGTGKDLAERHISEAKGIMRDYFIKLEDPDLAYLVEGTDAFSRYITDMKWAQDYAFQSRAQMIRELNRSLLEVAGYGSVLETINCHHNYTERVQTPEQSGNKGSLWITRKGAIASHHGQLGIVPGSMGTCSYIVEGIGNQAAYDSSSHGAGRRFSRGEARRTLDLGEFEAQMSGIVWQGGSSRSLLDEAPGAYKDVTRVMEDQSDLCKVVHTLTPVLNYKGTNEFGRRSRGKFKRES